MTARDKASKALMMGGSGGAPGRGPKGEWEKASRQRSGGPTRQEDRPTWGKFKEPPPSIPGPPPPPPRVPDPKPRPPPSPRPPFAQNPGPVQKKGTGVWVVCYSRAGSQQRAGVLTQKRLFPPARVAGGPRDEQRTPPNNAGAARDWGRPLFSIA